MAQLNQILKLVFTFKFNVPLAFGKENFKISLKKYEPYYYKREKEHRAEHMN